MTALNTIARKPDIRLSAPAEFVRQRIVESAAMLNLAGLVAARVELANEALSRFAECCYILDTDGQLANVDQSTYRLLIPAPWGKIGYSYWGLRNHEAESLRNVLRARQAAYEPRSHRPPLWAYDASARNWLLNLGDYQSLEAAGWWLKRSGVTVAEWRSASRTGSR